MPLSQGSASVTEGSGGGGGGGGSTFRMAVSDSSKRISRNATQSQTYNLSTEFDGNLTGDTWSTFDLLGFSSASHSSPNYSIARYVDIAADLASSSDFIEISPHNSAAEDYTITRTSDTALDIENTGSGSNYFGYVTLIKF